MTNTHFLKIASSILLRNDAPAITSKENNNNTLNHKPTTEAYKY